MTERNASVKTAPERWQDNKLQYDVVFTYEERVFDLVVEDLMNREPSLTPQLVHVFNIQTKDNHEEAQLAAEVDGSNFRTP
jgi:RNA polymerase II subunit A C-terminal domain phosphatase SSU72